MSNSKTIRSGNVKGVSRSMEKIKIPLSSLRLHLYDSGNNIPEIKKVSVRKSKRKRVQQKI